MLMVLSCSGSNVKFNVPNPLGAKDDLSEDNERVERVKGGDKNGS